MKTFLCVLSVAVMLVLASSADATTLTSPGFGGGNGHQGYMIMPEPYVDAGNQVQVPIVATMAPASYVPQLTPEKPGDTYTNKWIILNGNAYCRDYGWMDSQSNLSAGQYWWVKMTGHTAGLLCYDGGANLLFQNDGDKWEYPGGMLHNVYTLPSQSNSNVSATYQVYVGDSSGVMVNGITPGSVTLNWTAVPEPATMSLLAIGAIILIKRGKR